jgi:hypothetical protein
MHLVARAVARELGCAQAAGDALAAERQALEAHRAHLAAPEAAAGPKLVSFWGGLQQPMEVECVRARANKVEPREQGNVQSACRRAMLSTTA